MYSVYSFTKDWWGFAPGMWKKFYFICQVTNGTTSCDLVLTATRGLKSTSIFSWRCYADWQSSRTLHWHTRKWRVGFQAGRKEVNARPWYLEVTFISVLMENCWGHRYSDQYLWLNSERAKDTCDEKPCVNIYWSISKIKIWLKCVSKNFKF